MTLPCIYPRKHGTGRLCLLITQSGTGGSEYGRPLGPDPCLACSRFPDMLPSSGKNLLVFWSQRNVRSGTGRQPSATACFLGYRRSS